jgi:hypothetical protein
MLCVIVSGHTDTVSCTETWLRQLLDNRLVLPPNFDVEFFCRGVDVMIQSEHHQVISRCLTMLYNSAEVFMGEARRAVYIDLMLQRYFFRLFLHWDVNVRNTYHQLLAFKVRTAQNTPLHT